MHLSSQMFCRAISNTDEETLDLFFNDALNELQAWANKQTNIEHKPLNEHFFTLQNKESSIREIKGRKCTGYTFFNRFIPANVKDEYRFLCIILLQAVRLVGLLHDVGHLPYSHTFEKAMEKLFNKVSLKTDHTENEKEFLRLFNNYAGYHFSQALHEKLGSEMLKHIKEGISSLINPSDASDELVIFPLAFYVAEQMLSENKKDAHVLRDLHSIVAGTIDTDRLDYCSRDLFSSGVRKDCINYERIFSSFSIAKQVKKGRITNNYLFVPESKSIKEIEDVLHRRFTIFRDINYHHSVHKSDLLMINRIVEMGLNRLTQTEDEVANLGQTQLTIPGDIKDILDAEKIPLHIIDGLLFILYKLEKEGSTSAVVDALAQIDDGWVDTAFKQQANGRDMQSELISGRKEYAAVIKRFDDFLEFDSKLYTKFRGNDSNKVRLKQKIINAIAAPSTTASAAPLRKKAEKQSPPQLENEVLNDINRLFEFTANNSHKQYWRTEHSLFCNHLVEIITTACKNERFFQEFEDAILKNRETKDVLVGKIVIETGIKWDLFIKQTKEVNPRLVEFPELSNQDLFLMDEKKQMPTFHMYIKRDCAKDAPKLLNKVCNILFDQALLSLERYVDDCCKIT